MHKLVGRTTGNRMSYCHNPIPKQRSRKSDYQQYLEYCYEREVDISKACEPALIRLYGTADRDEIDKINEKQSLNDSRRNK